jgi:hypothetical protein
VLSDQAPTLPQALERAAAEDVPYVILDGKVFPATAATSRPSPAPTASPCGPARPSPARSTTSPPPAPTHSPPSTAPLPPSTCRAPPAPATRAPEPASSPR